MRDAVLGRSVEGRPVRLSVIGPRAAPVRVLVVGAVHGTEPAGRAIAARLRARPPRLPAGVALWVVHDLNPDGTAAGTRGNARGVDLNRNFPHRWRAQGRPGDAYHSGARPLSERESRLAARLIRRLRPAVTIWYHQALRMVDTGTVAHRSVPARYARLSGLPAGRIGFLPGVAPRWQNRLVRGSSAFVVELPGGPVGARGAARHAGAVRDAAARAARPRGGAA
ncbi:DUF2817 domain-containing protein [Miltoncostaea marina]|uniref:DUF2817 domain-containing protein n=1 Tax=Miltoncostaea marina TaxID=2843215 RepID=UPI001C3D08D4|nr:DUF2817 domain-containing protein [Miltoncostaea marina]